MPQVDLASLYMSRTYNARITRSPVSDRNKSNNRQADTQIILKNWMPFGNMTGTDQIKIIGM